MKNARIDVAKTEGEGLSLGENISITLTGTVKALETYDMTGPMVESDKKEKKEPPKVTVNLEYDKVEIKKGPKNTPKQAFDKAVKEAEKE